MHNFSSTAAGDSDVDALVLYRVWDADEDTAYDNLRTWETWNGRMWEVPLGQTHTPLCAIRTLAGQGQVLTQADEAYTLGPGSVLVIPWEDLARWHTVQDRWRLYWFEFFTQRPEHFQPYTPVHVTIPDAEINETAAIMRLLHRSTDTDRRHATARFAAMLYGWARAHHRDPEGGPSHRSGIERAIDLMHDRLHDSPSVAELAKAAGLKPRAFAVAFERVTGQPPKRYYLALRLEAARTLLMTGRFNVQQTAGHLGFSSPFHLSKAYKKHFGHPPSQAG